MRTFTVYMLVTMLAVVGAEARRPQRRALNAVSPVQAGPTRLYGVGPSPPFFPNDQGPVARVIRN
jgi:hypothetical protein